MKMNDQRNVLPIIFAVGLVLVSLLLVYNYTVKDVTLVTAPDRDTLAVSGTATKTVAPDKAEVYVRIRADAATSREAQAKGSQIVDAVIRALVQNGLAKDKIETVQYSVQRDERYNPETNEMEVQGYMMVQVLKLNIAGVERAGLFIDVAVQAGANSVDTIVFTLSKEREAEVKREVMQLAAEEARVKAEVLASGLRVSLKKLVVVSESSFNYIPMRASPGVVMFAAEKVAGTDVPPQGVEVSATVSVSYAI